MNKLNVDLTGLCGSVRYYGMNVENYMSDEFYALLDNLRSEMGSQFIEHELDDAYPFGRNNYVCRRHEGTMHTDPLRIQWVKDRIEQGTNNQSTHLLAFYKEWLKEANLLSGIN